jgi:Asparagine synthase
VPTVALTGADRAAADRVAALLAGAAPLGVAFSGGVDSSTLLALAARALGADQDEVVAQHGLVAVAYGENADDARRPDRPGARAATAHAVLRPLADAGLDKATVRRMARALDLPAQTSPPHRAWPPGSRTSRRSSRRSSGRSRWPRRRCADSASPTCESGTTATSPGWSFRWPTCPGRWRSRSGPPCTRPSCPPGSGSSPSTSRARSPEPSPSPWWRSLRQRRSSKAVLVSEMAPRRSPPVLQVVPCQIRVW